MGYFTRDDEFMAAIIDDSGHKKEYYPYAAFSLNGHSYVVMRTEETGMTEDVIVLRGHQVGEELRYTLIEGDEQLTGLIKEGLGLNYRLIS
ncbi:MAG: DUF1292 domain-containing protein [Clostridiales bacterium]|nr:DUF1292 domain-containing protein [Clostridiales bacterium]